MEGGGGSLQAGPLIPSIQVISILAAVSEYIQHKKPAAHRSLQLQVIFSNWRVGGGLQRIHAVYSYCIQETRFQCFQINILSTGYYMNDENKYSVKVAILALRKKTNRKTISHPTMSAGALGSSGSQCTASGHDGKSQSTRHLPEIGMRPDQGHPELIVVPTSWSFASKREAENESPLRSCPSRSSSSEKQTPTERLRLDPRER